MEIGYFRRSGKEREIVVTDGNHVFFHEVLKSCLEDSTSKPDTMPKELEVIYQGSGKVVSMLKAELELLEFTKESRPMSLFDVHGDFHTHLLLTGLPYVEEGKQIKHTALFRLPGSHRYDRVAIPVDDIYCLGGTVVKESLRCAKDFKHPPRQSPEETR